MRLPLDHDLLMFSARALLLHDLHDPDLVQPLPLVMCLNLRGRPLFLQFSRIILTDQVVCPLDLGHRPPREVSVGDLWLRLKPLDLLRFLLLSKALPLHLDPHGLADQVVSVRALEILQLVLQRGIS